MRKIYLTFLAFLLTIVGWSQNHTVTIGTGTSTQIYPLGNFYGYERSASIYTSAEISYSGNVLQLIWDANTGSLGSRPIKIYLKETTLSTLTPETWNTTISGATLVYDNSVDPVSGLNTFVTTATFNYSGSQNLMVLVEANYGGSGFTSSLGNSVKYSIATGKHMYVRADGSAPTGNSSVTNNRPNIQLVFPQLPNCTGTPSGGSVTVVSQQLCVNTTPVPIEVTNPNPGFIGFSYQWEESDDNGATDPWSNAVGGSGATTLSYTPPTFTGTTKYYRLKTTCIASNQFSYSTAHSVTSPTTPSSATGLTFTNITDGGLTVSWAHGGGNRRALVVNTSNVFTPLLDGTGPAYAPPINLSSGDLLLWDGTGTTNSLNITGMDCNTTYYFRIYEYIRCGSGPSYDYWHALPLEGNVTTVGFVDSLNSVALPVSCNFNGFTGSNLSTVFPGWEEKFGDGPLTGTSSVWVSSTVLGTTTAKVNLYTTSRKEWIISPSMAIDSVSRIRFKAAITDYASSSSDPLGMQGTDDEVQVMITDECSNNWTTLYTFNAATTVNLTNVLTEFVVNIPSSYEGKNVRIGFKATDGPIYDTPDYDFHITDINVEQSPAPTIEDVTITDVSCFGSNDGSVTVIVKDGALPLTYQWLPSGGTSSTADSLAAGTYFITVTDALNRSVMDSITISSPDEILIDFDYSDISCHGETNGWASVNPSGGVGPYTVLWSTNDTTDTINSLVAGHYSVTVTDSTGCTVTEDFDVIEPAVLSAAITSKTDVLINGGNNGSATVSVSGGTAPYSYLWTPSGQTTDTASNLTAGTYVVDITDAMGCTTQETVVITEPIPLTITLVSQKDILCNGDANGEITVDVSGDYPPYTYNWSPNVGNGATVSNLSAGIYTLTVTDAINDTTTETFTIVEPDPLVVTPGLVQGVSCFGSNDGSATVIVSGGSAPYSYLWSSGETTATAINLPAGNNIVQITDANGCQIQESFTVSEPAEIVIDLINITHVSCNGQSDGAVSISVTGGTSPLSYSWSNGQSTQNLSNIQGGSYTITVTDGNGCVASKTFTVINPGVVYPPTANNQGFCSDNNPQVSDLVATGTGVIKWYSSATGGTELAPNTALVNGQTYYASQTIANCESASRAAVLVSTSPSMQLVTTTLNVCNNSRIQDVTIDGLDHTQLKWYTSATTPIALGSNALLSSTTYYVSSFMNNTCESSRYAIQVTVLPITPAPSVSVQQLCGSGHTIDDLNISTNVPGATLSWYATPQATTPLAGTTMVYSGTYYVEQVVNSCASARVAVSVQIIPTAAPFISNISVCSGTTISDYNAQVAVNYVWFTDPTTSVSLGGNTPITSGTYYIAQETSGCVSNRAQVSVVAHQVPNSPTGQQVQTFNFAATIANLQMNEAGVLWFGNLLDAGSLSNPLAANTPLVDKAKYYGVLVGGGNCASLPTEVEVVINLSTQGLDLTALSYYPNPTEDILNISYAEAITQVEVYSISGQKVLSQEFDSKDVKIDLTGVASGTYMVKIATETASQYVKVVRK